MGLNFGKASASLSCVYGMTWNERLILRDSAGEPVDLVGADVVIRVRKRSEDTTHLLELRTDGDDPVLVVVGAGVPGAVDVNLPKELMQELPDPGKRKKLKYVWDSTVIRGAIHEPGMTGKFQTKQNTTRAWQASTQSLT